MASSKTLRTAVFALFFASGATGLVYEVVWTRLLSQSFGNTVFAVSTVLAVFMAGLGAGGLFFGRWIDRRRAILPAYGILEIGIGVLALVIPLLLDLIDPLITRLASGLQASFFGQSLLRLAAAFLLLFSPTFLMGGTLPVLSRLSSRRRETLGWDVGALYAVNTFGAMAGAFAAGFVLVKAWGLLQTELVAAGGNVLIGAIALLLSRSMQGGPAPARKEAAGAFSQPPTSGGIYPRRTVAVVLAAYALSGFAALASEVVWARVLVFFLGNSTYAFSTLLTTFLGGLALGSLLGSKIADRLRDPLRGLILVQAALAAVILATVPVLWKGLYSPGLKGLFNNPELPWAAYLGIKFLAAAAVLLVPALLFGAAFPLVCRITIVRLQTVGRGVGTIYAANTAGAILGPLVVGFVLVPTIGLQMSLVGISWVLGTAAVALTTVHPAGNPLRRVAAAAAVVGFCILSLLVFPLQPVLRSEGQSPDDRVLYYAEDHTATVLVYQKSNGTKYVSVDGHFIGATEHESDKKQKLLGHLPVLLASNPRSAITIGLGSGITLGALAQHPQLESIEAIEIVPSILRAATFFAEEHGSVLSDPRVRAFVGDGINYVKTAPKSFDVISSDAKLNPEFVGNTLVYTKEYYSWSRDRLGEGGVFVQWVPLYLPPPILRTVLRTFCQVFPAVDLWFFPQQHPILVGRRSPGELDLAEIRRRLARPGVREQLAAYGLADPYVIASSHVGDREQLLQWAGDGPVNSWDHPIIEFESVKQFRKAPRGRVEEENLRQLLSMMARHRPPFSNCDSDSLEAYVESFRLVLRGLLKSRPTDLLTYGAGDFRQALEQNPGDGRAKDLLALVAAESHLAEQAAQRLAEGPSDGVRLASLLYAEGKLVEAERTARASIARQPRSADAHNLLGLILQRQGKTQEAITAFQKALSLNPESAEIGLNLGTAYERSNRLSEALEVLLTTLQLDPDSPELHNNLGIVYARLGRHSEAEAEYRKAIQLDPQNADALNNLGIVLGGQGRLSEAVEVFEKALRADPGHADALKNLGIAHLQRQEFAAAIPVLVRALDRKPRDVDILTNLGLAYAQNGLFDKARECWQQALAIDPTVTEARRNLELLKKMLR